jgi:hypothetical protein
MNFRRCIQLGVFAVAGLFAHGHAIATTTVEVTGYSTVIGDDLKTARSQAILNAQKKALELSTGYPISGVKYYDSTKALKADENNFKKNIVDKVGKKSSGFVSQFRLLDERRRGDVLTVRLAVRISSVNLMREVAILQRKISGARFPKIMFVVDEQYVSRAKKISAPDKSVLLASLEDAFIKSGFDIIGKEATEGLRKQERSTFDGLLSNDGKAAEFALKYGAEYVISGSARAKHTSYNDLGLNEHHGHVEISVRAINASTGAVIASTTKTGQSAPNAYNEDDLRIRLIQKASRKANTNLITRLLQSWDRETENGIRYSLKFYNVASYKRVGLQIMKLLGTIDNVRAIKKISYVENRLEIEVFYTSLKDVSALEAAILESSNDYEPLKTLDIKYARGRELNFQL